MADALPPIRRQIYELSIEDLENHSVWEFALDEEGVEGQDEATVRPYLKLPVNPADGLQIVKAKFTFADGTEAVGFFSPHPLAVTRDIQNEQPVIVLRQGQIPLYFGIFPPKAEMVASLLNMLGKSDKQVFPLEYEADVEIVGGPIKAIVRGFSF